MKRFHFELEPVLRHKLQLEREAEARVAAALARLQQAREELHRQQQELRKLSEEIACLGVQPAAIWNEKFDRMLRISEALKQAEQAVEGAQQRLEQEVQARSKLGVEVETFQQLKMQRWREYRVEREKAQQKELDDRALRRHIVESDLTD